MPSEDTQFKPGNLVAVKHGARSQQVRARVRRELVEEMREVVLAEVPEDRRVPGTSLLVDMAAVAAADVRQLRDYIDAAGGPISPRGQLRKAVEMLRAREKDLLGYFDRLGFGPRSAAQMVGSLVASNGGLGAQLAARRATAVLAVPLETTR